MRQCSFVLFLLLLTAGAVLAQFSEYPAPATDTTSTDSAMMWNDTSLSALPDSASPASFRHGWLFPMGILAATCMGFIMLFTTRSR